MIVFRNILLLTCFLLAASSGPVASQIYVPMFAPIPGDSDENGFVDANDLILLQQNWHVGIDCETKVLTVEIANLPAGARPLRLVRVPAGSFWMGNGGTDRDVEYGRSDEYPHHQVTVVLDSYIGETEVTQGQWKAVMGVNPATGQSVGDDFPVYGVSWEDSQDFVVELNNLNQGWFRLPYEFEWEYACRGSALNPDRYAPFSFGDDTDHDLLSCGSSSVLDRYMVWCGNQNDGAEEVASRLPNDLGLYDMHGNLWEWCEYGYSPTYSGPSWWYSPRVIRGGSWSNPGMSCRSAMRNKERRSGSSNGIGLRVVRAGCCQQPLLDRGKECNEVLETIYAAKEQIALDLNLQPGENPIIPDASYEAYLNGRSLSDPCPGGGTYYVGSLVWENRVVVPTCTLSHDDSGYGMTFLEGGWHIARRAYEQDENGIWYHRPGYCFAK
jgi:formylglycine-generating enzyme required for sulfatase activity